jgi:hypothetical protein
LLEQPVQVDGVPVLGHPAVAQLVDVDAGDGELPSGERYAQEGAGVGAGLAPAGDDMVVFGDQVLEAETAAG